jgi:hypothetical protein
MKKIESKAYRLHVGFLFGLLSSLGDGSDLFLQNVG